MGREMYPALSGGLRSMRQLDVLANNLANVNTTGFKADRVHFELTSPTKDGAMGEGERKLAASFVTGLGEVTDYSQGMVRDTGNPTDFALRGEDGFFQLLAPEGAQGGPILTRDGTFFLDPEGFLTAGDGFLVQGADGEPIKVSGGGELVADHEGKLTLDGTAIGQLAIVDVADRTQLAKTGGGRWQAPPDTEVAPAAAEVLQGQLETSNVEPIHALTELIAITRYYEAFQKNLEASSKLDEALNNQVGRIDR